MDTNNLIATSLIVLLGIGCALILVRLFLIMRQRNRETTPDHYHDSGYGNEVSHHDAGRGGPLPGFAAAETFRDGPQYPENWQQTQSQAQTQEQFQEQFQEQGQRELQQRQEIAQYQK
ncbi:MAG: hypothetical protein AAF975_01835, partial [Spirochaetota bacterium]